MLILLAHYFHYYIFVIVNERLLLKMAVMFICSYVIL